MTRMTGDAFDAALHAGEIPPPSDVWINRYLRGDPLTWRLEYGEFRAEVTPETLEVSLGKLVEMLQRVAHEGAPLPVIQAAEEATTLNLVALTVNLGEGIHDRQASRLTKWGVGDETDLRWFEGMDLCLLILCEETRERCVGFDALPMTVAPAGLTDPAWKSRPDLVVEFTIEAIRDTADEIEADIEANPDAWTRTGPDGPSDLASMAMTGIAAGQRFATWMTQRG